MVHEHANYFKPDSTITLIKGFPLKGPCVYAAAEDQTIDLKDVKHYEGNE